VQGRGCACVYYGEPSVEAYESLRGCEILVLPPTVEPVEARRVASPRLVLGYVSLLTIGGWEPWAKMVPRDIIVGEWREWGEYVVNACSDEWRKVLDYAVRYVESRGFDGVFLDNLDLVDEYEWMAGCAASLVARVREEHPGAKIMVNRGFSILDSIAPYIDHLLVESYPSYYEGGSYKVWSGDDLVWIVEKIRHAQVLARRYGFGVHALAYGDPGDKTLVSKVCRVVNQYTPGLDVYMAPWLLKKPGVCLDCATTTPRATRSGGAETIRGGRVSISMSPGPLGLAGLGLAAVLALLLLLRLRRGRR